MSRRGRGITMMGALAAVVLVAGAIAVAGDVRSVANVIRAPDADVRIRIIRRATWWQLEYGGRGIAFTSANELHIPTRQRVALTWVGMNVPASENLSVER